MDETHLVGWIYWGWQDSRKAKPRFWLWGSRWDLIGCGTAIQIEITFTIQERGKEWESRIAAIDKSCEGEPSNTVVTVL
ncbi:MAG: hypothetical protein ABIK83_13395 [Candidatus Zixiibacteriota bacterium]